LNSLLEQFEAVDTQVLGMSVDSKYTNHGWAEGFGGITYPLMADFHVKGEVSKKYGLWLDEAGISDRATILIDKEGKVLWSESVGPGGARQPMELLEKTKSLV